MVHRIMIQSSYWFQLFGSPVPIYVLYSKNLLVNGSIRLLVQFFGGQSGGTIKRITLYIQVRRCGKMIALLTT